ncbi:MAG: peptidylprolyl isomerase [Elusimicrobia bacterium]|nr:peptidylprolyl isomerase [Elusimicrobiota bacterium]
MKPNASSRRLFLVAALAGAFAACSRPTALLRPEPEPAAPPAPAPDLSTTTAKKEIFAVLETAQGIIEVRLLAQEAPKTVENFTGLASGKKEWTDPASGQKTTRPLYDGSRFFRAIPGFIIQGGDPKNDGTGGPGYAFEDEILPGRAFNRPGLVAMVNSGPNTNGSQFFITLAPLPWLTGKHTIFGEVVKGLEAALAIAAAPREAVDQATGRPIDRPKEPQFLKSVRIEER